MCSAFLYFRPGVEPEQQAEYECNRQLVCRQWSLYLCQRKLEALREGYWDNEEFGEIQEKSR